MNRFPRILDRRRAPALALVALSGIAQAVAAGAAALATRDVFAALQGSAGMPVASLQIILAAGLAIAVLRLGERALAEWTGQHYAASLRHNLFRHLTRLSPRELAKRRAGALALRFVGDLSAVRIWVSLGIARIVSAAFVLPGAMAALWLLNPALALAAAPALLAGLLLMASIQRFLDPLHRRLRSLRGRIAVDVSERAPVAAELRLLGRDDMEVQQLDDTALRLRRSAVNRAAAAAGLAAIPEVAFAVTGVAFLVLAFQQGLSSADTAAALALLGILAVPMNQLAGVWDRRRAWHVAREKCLVLFDMPELPERTAAGSVAPKPGLRLEAVSGPDLGAVTGEIEPGRTVAVLGPNGAGKSTLLALIAGLDRPASGQIALNGGPVEAHQVCYIGRRSPILRGSLRRALTLGIGQRPSDQEIIEVAHSFGLEPLLRRLGGLGGRVEEAGRNLSAGEARRVHLVRAALSQAEVLLLDEPEDALDPEGRALVAKLIEGTTAITLCVTHDLALARMADQIWFVADGAVRVRGEPEALLTESGPVRDFAGSCWAA